LRILDAVISLPEHYLCEFLRIPKSDDVGSNKDRPVTVIILTSRTTPNIYLVNNLTARHHVIAKVIEARPGPSTAQERLNVRLGMMRKYGLARTLNKLFYNKYRSHFIHKKREALLRSRLFPGDAKVEYTADIPTLEVRDINDQSCKEFLAGHRPDMIAVCGTTVLKPEVFNLSSKGTINIHVGITPEYRSADPIFWALYNGEPDKVGVTIHFVDQGIDTGDIIFQATVELTREDDPSTLYAKCIQRGAELMSQTIEEIAGGTVKTYRKEGVEGKAYFHMDLGIVEYLIFLRRFRKLKKNLLRGA